jgi:glutathione peroxidase
MLKPVLGAAAAITVIAAAPAAVNSAYDIKMTAIDGKPLPLAKYKGQVMMVVNTASFCGYTPQYEALQKVHETYKAKGFTVLGVPSGDFKGQEYGSNKEIAQFCESKFGIRFPMAEKASVIGPNAAPFYRWAQSELGTENVPKWNFHKYLVGRDGKLIAAFPSKVKPDDPQVIAAIEKALAAPKRG